MKSVPHRAAVTRFAACLLGVLAAACSSPARPKSPPPAPPSPSASARPAEEPVSPNAVALTHVTVLDLVTGEAERDRTITIDGDRIVDVTTSPRPGVREIDLRDKFVIPGLWDMHVHFARPALGRLFIANGVTGVRVMWGNPKLVSGQVTDHFGMRDVFDKKSQLGPRMVIASQVLDGPMPVWPGSVALATPDDGRKAVDEAKKSGVDFVKVYSKLPRDVFFAIAEESKAQGMSFEGHTPDAVTVAEASDAGQKSVEHLTGMLLACSSHETKLRKSLADYAKTGHSAGEWRSFMRKLKGDAIASYDSAVASKIFAKLIANETWQCPTMTVNYAMSHLNDPSLANDPRNVYVPAIEKKRWSPAEDFRTKNRTEEDYVALRREFDQGMTIVRDMHKAGVPILAGTDQANPYCFAGFSLHDELAWLVKAGLTPLEALRTATVNPARFLGTTDRMGAVAKNKVADLVVLEADPRVDIANTKRVVAVVTRGTVLGRADLDRVLEGYRATVAGVDAKP